MIEVTPTISIPEGDIQEEFIRSTGPGGQHVNKASTAVQLRFDVANSPHLPEDVRQRLIKLAGKRVTSDGVLVIEAKRFRYQELNRQDALRRLVDFIRAAARKPRVRTATRPSAAARRRRLAAKRRRAQTKRHRRPVSDED